MISIKPHDQMRPRPPPPARCAALVVMGVGLTGLFGWIFDIPELRTIVSRGIQMKTNMAIALVLAGLSLWLLAGAPARRWPRWLAGAAAALVLVIGALTLSEHFFGLDFGIDQLLFAEPPGAPATASPNRLGPPGAAGLVLAGACLLMLLWQGRCRIWYQALAVALGLIASLSIFGYAFGASALYGLAKYTGIAFHTSLALTALAAGLLLARPDQGIASLIFNQGTGGAVARRLLPPAIILPFVLGWLRMQGERMGVFDPAFGTAMVMLVLLVITSALVLVHAGVLAREDRDRRQAEETLRERTKELQTLLEHLPVGVFIAHDPKCSRITGNPVACQMLRLPLAANLSKTAPFRELPTQFRVFRRGVEIPVEELPVQRAARGEQVQAEEVDHVFDDGAVIHALVSAAPLFDELGAVRGAVATILDITERKQAAAALRRQAALIQAVNDNTTELIFMKDLEGRLTYANAATLSLMGLKEEQAIGREAPERFTVSKERVSIEDNDRRVAATGETVTVEEPYTGADGRKRTFQSTKSPLRDASGRIIGAIGVSRDITDIKQTEEALRQGGERLRALSASLAARNLELEAVNKELESFIYSIAHDLRAPARHMTGFAEALLEDYQGRLDKQAEEYLRRIERGANKMTRLIDDLLRLSRISRQEMVRAPVDLSTLAQTIIAGLRESDPDRRIAVSVVEGISALADKGLMEIALANLLENAWKFTARAEDARIEIGAMNQESCEQVFYVRDNGAGFDPRHRDKMFRPFHRLHPEKEFAGTGIGLAIVERIIHRHGGRIWAEGEVGEGASFYFTLK